MRINVYDDNIGHVLLVDNMGNDLRAVESARVSFLLDNLDHTEPNDKDKRLLKFLLKEGHTSPFEHSVITFRLHVPLFVRSQIMRHRTFSYNEVSRRYTSEELQAFIPSTLRAQSKKNLQCSDGELENHNAPLKRMAEHIDTSLALYNRLLDAGVAREQARAILPQAMYTTFWMTGNLHNWLKFFRLRTTDHAQEETRLVALAIQDIMKKLYPTTFDILKQLNDQE